jgi:hypothetical protein
LRADWDNRQGEKEKKNTRPNWNNWEATCSEERRKVVFILLLSAAGDEVNSRCVAMAFAASKAVSIVPVVNGSNGNAKASEFRTAAVRSQSVPKQVRRSRDTAIERGSCSFLFQMALFIAFIYHLNNLLPPSPMPMPKPLLEFCRSTPVAAGYRKRSCPTVVSITGVGGARHMYRERERDDEAEGFFIASTSSRAVDRPSQFCSCLFWMGQKR